MIITEVRKIVITDYLRDPVRIGFLTRKGAMDEVLFTKYIDQELNTKPQFYGSGNTERTFAINSTSRNVYYSPWFAERDFAWMKELMLSPYVTVNGKYVRVLDNNYKFDNQSRLFMVELEVSPEFEENSITL